MSTITAPDISRGELTITPLKLPRGMGIGALRNTLAHALIYYWQDAMQDGIAQTIANHPNEFLGEAATYTLLEANDTSLIPDETRREIKSYLDEPRTLIDFDDQMVDLYVDALALRAETFLTSQVLTLTGYDPDTEEGRTALRTYIPRVA